MVANFSRPLGVQNPVASPAIPNPPAMTLYSYHPLESSCHIRLLNLLPSTTQTLHCELLHVSLDNLPHYEALSYTWGSPTKTSFIQCDTFQVPLTANCASALRRLLDPSRSRLVWIDQICINQDDIPERNHQVTLMTSIYSLASRVVVWLGEGTPESDECVKLMNKYEKSKAVQALAISQTIQIYPDEAYLENILPADEDITPWFDKNSPLRKALKDILLRPWFSRVWIIQEVSVAREIEMLCGDLSMPYEKLHDVLGFVQGITPEDLGPPWDGAFLFNIIREDLATPDSLKMRDVTIRTRMHEATDKRDKIFALRGICKELREHCPMPDYSKPEHEVYLDAAKAYMRIDDRISFLCYGVNIRDVPGLPSWCPDFGGPVMNTALPGHSTRLLEKSKPKFVPTTDGVHLFLKGKIVDTVASLGEKADWRDDAPLWSQELKTWKHWLEIARTVHKFYRKETIEVVFWRTMFVDSEDWLMPEARAVNEEAEAYWKYVLQLREWFKNSNPSDDNLEDGLPDETLIRHNVTHARKWTREKRVCVTGKGLFGLALPNAEVGDVVAYLASASIPFLLRRVEVGKGKGKEKWRLVGPVYVHGIMNGELYPSTRFGLRDITLI
jgi:hypothetical protein